MRATTKHLLKGIVFGAVGIAIFNVVGYQVFAQSGSCSNRTCVKFVQWGYTSGGSFICRHSAGGETWAFLDACCYSAVDPSWCTSLNYQISLGDAVCKAMQYGTVACSSCDSAKVQVVASNMFIENVVETRYACSEFVEE